MLKRNLSFDVNTTPREQPDGSPCTIHRKENVLQHLRGPLRGRELCLKAPPLRHFDVQQRPGLQRLPILHHNRQGPVV